MDEGRDGGRPGSPAGPVMPMMRAPVELFGSGVVMAAVGEVSTQLLAVLAA